MAILVKLFFILYCFNYFNQMQSMPIAKIGFKTVYNFETLFNAKLGLLELYTYA